MKNKSAKQHTDRVIVVGDGCTDCTSEVARFAGAEVISNLNSRFDITDTKIASHSRQAQRRFKWSCH